MPAGLQDSMEVDQPGLPKERVRCRGRICSLAEIKIDAQTVTRMP